MLPDMDIRAVRNNQRVCRDAEFRAMGQGNTHLVAVKEYSVGTYLGVYEFYTELQIVINRVFLHAQCQPRPRERADYVGGLVSLQQYR